MRFLIVTQYFPPEIGASQARLGAVAKSLVTKGHEVEVVTALPNHPTGKIFPAYKGRFCVKEEWCGCIVRRVWVYAALGAGVRRILNYLSFTATAIVGLCRAQRPDVLFVESPPPFIMLPAIFMNLFWRARLVMNVADLWPDSITGQGLMKDGVFMRAIRLFERWCYRHAHIINAVTNGIKETLIHKKNVPNIKILFFPNGADTEVFAPRASNSDLQNLLGLGGKKVILYAGTIGYSHGLEVGVSAMSKLSGYAPDVHLLVIGDGSARPQLKKMATDTGLPNITFLNPQPPEYVAELYTFAIAGLSTLKPSTFFEGTRPSKIFPIMASCKPVIYSGAGEGARLIQEANAGVVVEPGNAGALADAILFLVRNPDEAQEYGRNGRIYVVNNLSWERIVTDWLAQLASAQPRCERIQSKHL